MTKIGLIDYYLAEWHAENYPAWLRRYNSEHGTDFEIAFAYNFYDKIRMPLGT